MLTRPKRTRIVSSIPGRTRIRLSPKRRTKEEMGLIVKALKEHLDITETRTNVHTGSILVRHPRHNIDDIYSVLQDLGVILGSVAGIPVSAPAGKTRVAADLVHAVSDLNRRIGLTTHGFANLRVLIPLGFASLAVLQLVRRGFEFEAAPWYVLAYVAFDSFAKLQHTDDGERVK